MNSYKFAPAGNPSLHSILRERVNQYFKSNNISNKANGYMVLKTIILLIMFFGPYAMILTGLFPGWAMLLLTVFMGIGHAGLGMGLMHDSCHNSYSKNPTVNKILSYSMNLIGGNRFNWIVQHNIKHHTYTNIHGMDEDLDNGDVIRLSPHSDYHGFHKYQHIYSWFLYMLGTLTWVTFKDFKQMVHLYRANYKDFVKTPVRHVIIAATTKIMYYGYLLVIPSLVLDVSFWWVLLGFIIMHLVSGLILSVTFQLAHVVEGVEHTSVQHTNSTEDIWVEHQVKTTANFARKSRILNWYLGGLNFQVEHHLFPNICHVHYAKIAPIVKETVEEFGLKYNEQPTMASAIKSHYKSLKAYSQPSRSVA